MELGLTLVGLSHRTASLEVRERYVVSHDDLPACLAALTRVEGVHEAFVLSTCNRTEGLVVGEPHLDLVPALRAHLFRNLGDGQVYVWRGVQALIHVFRVASGLDSMVIGESEVLRQLRRGIEIAQGARTLGGTLAPLLQQALQVGKRVRAQTVIGQGTLSVAQVAVDVAAQAFGRFEHCRALVIGAGETGILVARNFLYRGLKRPTFASRTLERARDAARDFGGCGFTLEDLPALVSDADIIVACVEGADTLLGPEAFDKRAMRKRDRPILVIDLSVPRAIDRSLARLPNLLLYDLDDLQRVVQANQLRRVQSIESATGILVSELHKFLALRAYAAFTPAIASMRERFERTREEVLDSVAGASSDRKNIEIAHVLSRKLLDVALDHMKEGARATSSEETLEREYQRFLQNQAGGPE